MIRSFPTKYGPISRNEMEGERAETDLRSAWPKGVTAFIVKMQLYSRDIKKKATRKVSCSNYYTVDAKIAQIK